MQHDERPITCAQQDRTAATGLQPSAGASLVEYALLIGLVATIGILAIRSLGQTVSQQFSVATGILAGG